MSSLTEQMARLIGNRLAKGDALFLPEVGSLYVEQHRAQPLTKRTVRPPYKSIAFTSQEQGLKLPELIASAAACDAERARSVYDRWLAQVRTEQGLTIEGIGELAHKHFTPTEAFDKRLNPHGHAPVRVRRKGGFDWVLALGVVAILLVAGAAGYFWMTYQKITSYQPIAVAPASGPAAAAEERIRPADPVAAEVPADATPESAPAASEQSTESPAEQAPAPAVQAPSAASEELTRTVSGHHYVVMGVFSTRENAEAARKHFAGQQPDWNFRIYLFGSKFLLACHSSESEAEVRDFVRNHHSQYPDLWVHSAR